MNGAFSQIITVAVAIIGLATLAVIVSKNAATPQVIQAAGQALTSTIGAAVAPVTGGSFGYSGAAPGYPSIL